MASKYDELVVNVKKYYCFAQAIKYYSNLLMQVEESKKFIPYFICLDNYAERLIAYTTFTFADLQVKKSIILPKSDANRIYLRGCLESCFIINILLNNYSLSEKFMSNIKADIKKINAAYKDSSINRKTIYKEYYEEDLEDIKYERRYSWLPRRKKKKAANISDLVNYMSIEDDAKRAYFEMYIRALDSYSHPSFYIPSMFHAPKLNANFKEIYLLYDDGEIINECNKIIINSLNAFLKSINMEHSTDFLELMNNAYEINSTPITSMFHVNDYILNESDEFKKEDICRFLWNRFDINKFYLSHVKQYPQYIHNITLGFSMFIDYLKSKNDNTNYKLVNTIMLLEDALLRYDEFLKAYTTDYITSFYVQSRYLIEFIVNLNILLNEDEERSYVYFIHQDIKSYQYKQNIYSFYKTQNLSNPQVEKNIERIEEKNKEDVKFIHDYYLNKFNHEVDDKTISRLNGWAIHLKGLDNEEVYNLPLLLSFSIDDLIKNVQEMFKSMNLMNISDFVQGYYEESCAYSHVTPYAFFNNLKIYGSNALIKEQFIVINLLIVQLYSKIISVLHLDENDPDLKHVENLLINSLMTLVITLNRQK